MTRLLFAMLVLVSVTTSAAPLAGGASATATSGSVAVKVMLASAAPTSKPTAAEAKPTPKNEVIQGSVPTPQGKAAQDPDESMITLFGHPMTFTDSIVAISAGVSALATVVLTFATLGLWFVTRKLWRETANAGETTKQAVEVAKQSAEATRLAAEVSLAGERPRLMIKSVIGTYFNKTADNINWWVEVSLKNFGRSDAEILQYTFQVVVKPMLDPIPRHSFNDLLRADHLNFGSVLEQQKSITISKVMAFTPENRQQIEVHETRLWVYGFFVYRDSLDHEWEQGFVALLGPDLQPLQWEPFTGHRPRAVPLNRPPRDAGVEAYTYTRKVDSLTTVGGGPTT